MESERKRCCCCRTPIKLHSRPAIGSLHLGMRDASTIAFYSVGRLTKRRGELGAVVCGSEEKGRRWQGEKNDNVERGQRDDADKSCAREKRDSRTRATLRAGAGDSASLGQLNVHLSIGRRKWEQGRGERVQHEAERAYKKSRRVCERCRDGWRWKIEASSGGKMRCGGTGDGGRKPEVVLVQSRDRTRERTTRGEQVKRR